MMWSCKIHTETLSEKRNRLTTSLRVIQDGSLITSSKCPYYAKYYGGDHGTSELTELFIAAIQK